MGVIGLLLVFVVLAAVVGPGLVRVRPRHRRRGRSRSGWLGRLLLVRVLAWLVGVDVPGK